ncbi:g8679 [Coccomyxa viridis]|uniref:G8679 protein n=1 Tax=Coccomyxa viridis TaxID=1274662 RepID=A0ABP1G223_9CHLO
MEPKEYANGIDMDRYPSVVLINALDTPSTAFETEVFLQGSCGETGAHPGGEVKREDAAAQNISPRGVLDKPLHSVSTMTTEEGQGRCRPFGNEELLQSGRIQSFSMEQDDHTSDEEDPSEDESCLRRSARNHGTDRLHSSPREKRKVGRPIIYSGDPDAPDLTPQERRRIRRRIANRESARRVRAKRQDLIEEMSIKAQEMQEVNAKLVARAQSVEEKHNQMMQHVTQMNECLKQKTLDNERLQMELNLLKRSMKDKGEGGGSGNSSQSNGQIGSMQGYSGQQQLPAQPAMPSTTVTSGAIGVLQSHVPQQSHAQQHQPQMGAFHFSAFNAAAQVPQMDALEMQLASMQGMPGYGSPLQCQASAKDQLGQGQQEGSTSTSLPAMPRPAQMMPNPARVPSKEHSLEGVIGSMSMDRSLSEFLHEVTCL